MLCIIWKKSLPFLSLDYLFFNALKIKMNVLVAYLLSIYLPISIYLSKSIQLSIYLSKYLSIYKSIYLSNYLSNHLFGRFTGFTVYLQDVIRNLISGLSKQ